jgi:predicted site-specific integrase-resolvase
MPFEIDDYTYYRTSEVCARVGISRATLFRWLKAGILEKRFKDRRGWGIFTENDIEKIIAEAKTIKVQYITTGNKESKRY